MMLRHRSPLFYWLPAGLTLLMGPVCGATPSGDPNEGGYVTHEVVAGDTLPSVGAHYLQQPDRWKALQRINGIVDASALVPGTTVNIPARLIRSSAVMARVEVARGKGVLDEKGIAVRRAADHAAVDDNRGTSITAEARLAERARIHVPEDGYLRLRLADGSIVHVLAGTDVELKRLRRRPDTKHFETVLELKKGTVESEVSKQPAGRVFEIRAPGAVASVRGTKFGVSVEADGRTLVAVTEGEVVLRARTGAFGGGARVLHVGAGRGVAVAHDGGRIWPCVVQPAALDARLESGACARPEGDAHAPL